MTETIRPAAPVDLSHIAILLDMASHGLLNDVWRQQAGPGQSAFEFGRDRIRTRKDLPSYLENWRVLVRDKHVCGGNAGYVVPDPYDPGDTSDLPDYYDALLNLEAQAAGSWHMIALAVFPEFRGHGIGRRLLKDAEERAALSGCTTASIISKSSNHPARALYEKSGYLRVAERPAASLPGAQAQEQWYLYQRRLPDC